VKVHDEDRLHDETGLQVPDDPQWIDGSFESITAHVEGAGHNGTFLFDLTSDDLDRLRAGQAIVCGVNLHEYGVVIRLSQ
jgi:hypothetical protein